MTREEALTRDETLPHSREVLINQIFDEHEEQLKAKDEEIEKLKQKIVDLSSSNLEYEIKEYKKSRSIVAMLFWEWRKVKEFTNSSLSKYDKGITEGMSYSFNKAYKALKDN